MAMPRIRRHRRRKKPGPVPGPPGGGGVATFRPGRLGGGGRMSGGGMPSGVGARAGAAAAADRPVKSKRAASASSIPPARPPRYVLYGFRGFDSGAISPFYGTHDDEFLLGARRWRRPGRHVREGGAGLAGARAPGPRLSA